MAVDPKRKKRLIILGSILGIMFFLCIAALLMPAQKPAEKQNPPTKKADASAAQISSYDDEEYETEDNSNEQLKMQLEALKYQSPAPESKKVKKSAPVADSEIPDNIQILQEGTVASTVQISDKKGRWNPVAGNQPVSGTLAERLLPKDGTRLRWVPKQISGDTMPVRLTDAKLSPDGSVVAFVETTGPREGPYGSRIVLMDTNSWTTVKICEIKHRHIIKIQWIPGKDGWLGAICRLYPGEDEDKQLPGVALIDLLEGTEKHFYTLPDETGRTGFITNGKTKLLLSHPKKPVICVIDAASPEKPVAETAAPGINCVLALSADQKCFAVLPEKNAKRIDIFKTSDLLPLANVKWGGLALNPAEMYFAKDNRTFFVCSQPNSNQPAYYVTDGQVLPLPGIAPGKNDISSGKGAVSQSGKELYSLLYGNNELCVINAANGQLIRAIEINDITPKPGKRPALIARIFLIPQLKAVAALDDNGFFYLVKTTQQKQGKLRDERAIIFAPQQ